MAEQDLKDILDLDKDPKEPRTPQLSMGTFKVRWALIRTLLSFSFFLSFFPIRRRKLRSLM